MKMIRITGAALLAMLLGAAAFAYAGQERQSDKQDHSKPNQKSHEQARPQKQHARGQKQVRHEQTKPQQHIQQARQANKRAQQQHTQQSRQNRRKVQPRSHVQPSRQAHAQPRQEERKPQQRSKEQRPERAPRQPQQAQRQQHGERAGRGQEHIQHAETRRSPEQQRAERTVWQQHRAGNWQSDHRTWQQRGGYHGYRIPEYRYRGYFGRSHWFRIGGLPFMVEGGYPRFQYRGYWFTLLDPWPAYWGNEWYDNDDVYVDYYDGGYYLFNRRYPGMGIAISISM